MVYLHRKFSKNIHTKRFSLGKKCKYLSPHSHLLTPPTIFSPTGYHCTPQKALRCDGQRRTVHKASQYTRHQRDIRKKTGNQTLEQRTRACVPLESVVAKR